MGELTINQLQNLYYTLKLTKVQIDRAERQVDSKDEDRKARSVLHSWRQLRGQQATMSNILKKIRKRGYVEVAEKLEERVLSGAYEGNFSSIEN